MQQEIKQATPEFTNWRVVPWNANSVRIYPNKIGSKFSQTDIEYIKKIVCSTYGKPVNSQVGVITVIYETKERMNAALPTLREKSIHGVRDRERQHRRKEERERQEKAKKDIEDQYQNHPAYKWVSERFPDISNHSGLSLCHYLVTGNTIYIHRFALSTRVVDRLVELGYVKNEKFLGEDLLRDYHQGCIC